MKVVLVVNNPLYHAFLVPALGARQIVVPDASLRHGPLLRGPLARGLRQLLLSLRFIGLAVTQGRDLVFVCITAHYAVLLASRLANLLGRPSRVFLFNFFINKATRRGIAQAFVRWVMGQSIGVFVNSPNEVEYFRLLNRSIVVSYYPYCLESVRESDIAPATPSDYVFAGGYTNRDYDLLLRVAARLGNINFLVACSKASVIREPVPANVTLVFDSDKQEFRRHLACSRVVVVPLVSDLGSSGQMVALAAMQLAKVVVYAECSGLTQYFEHNVTGLAYTIGDEESLLVAIQKALSEPGVPSKMGNAAKAKVEASFTRAAHDRELLLRISEFCKVR